MRETTASGVRIRYSVAGRGQPVVLIHGYTGSATTNWQLSGCTDALAREYRVIAPDLRGHGNSDKPRRASAYSLRQMAADVLAVMDAEDVARARIAGYSLGGMIALELLLDHRERVRAAVIGGMGAHLPRKFADGEMCGGCPGSARGLAPARRVSARFIARYARHIDPLAVFAAYRALFRAGDGIDASRLAEIAAPVLCVAGTRDHLCHGARKLADAIPGATLQLLPGESHLSAIGAPLFRESLLRFFASV